MEESMRTLLSVVAVFALASPAAAAARGASAIVVVAENGGFPAATVQTVRSLTATELRVRGLDVRDEPSEASRQFVLSLGRLEQKVLITLEDVVPPATVPEFAVTHAAASLDEADIVIPRLVRAVLEREPFESSARMGTVTAQESAPFRSRPGEGLFILGIGLEPLGGSIGWSYEARRFRLGVLAQGAGEHGSFLGIDGAWLPYDGNVSPYLGAGLGIVDGGNDASLGTKLEVGIEFFRLHGVRLMAGVGAIVPFESLPGEDRVSWSLTLRCGF
jgi:hypothetical protein